MHLLTLTEPRLCLDQYFFLDPLTIITIFDIHHALGTYHAQFNPTHRGLHLLHFSVGSKDTLPRHATADVHHKAPRIVCRPFTKISSYLDGSKRT